MTQISLLDLPQTKTVVSQRPLSLTDKVATYFKQHPNRAIPTWELAQIGGIGGWRSRVVECRFAPYGMRIINEQHMEGRRRLSFYKYVPNN